jgi:hypothetical protein
LTAICCVESSCLIPLDCHLFCREFMFDSSQSRRIKHELPTTQMVVKTNQTWTLYKTNGCQDESNMNSLQNKWQSRLTAICFVESSYLIRLDCHLVCRVHVWFVLTAISFMNSLQHKWQSRRIKHELSTKQMAVKTNQTWTLYTTNGCQDDSNRLPFVLYRVHVWFVLPTICFVESSCLIRLDNVKANQIWTLYKTNGSQDE